MLQPHEVQDLPADLLAHAALVNLVPVQYLHCYLLPCLLMGRHCGQAQRDRPYSLLQDSVRNASATHA